MPRCTIVAPRNLWPDVISCLRPVPPCVIICCREAKPDEVVLHSTSNEVGVVIYQVRLVCSEDVVMADIELVTNCLQVTWPYVRAEKEAPLWFEPTLRNPIVHPQQA